MWVGVRERFSKFDINLVPSQNQTEDAQNKQLNVRKNLHRAYYGSDAEIPVGFLVGSWGKGTQTAPPNDIDILFPLPAEVYHRFNAREGNKQSALLQEVKGYLQQSYGQTDMRGDGQVVQIAFNSILLELVPVFQTSADNEYLMPDTNDGGSWKATYPIYDIVTLDASDRETYGNTRSLIRMLKTWKRFCNVPLKSYILERLVINFLESYKYSKYSYFWYDWVLRDFFKYIVQQSNKSLWLPSDAKQINIGDAWLPKAKKAVTVSHEACEFEHKDLVYLAGSKWQEIFGYRIEAG